MVSRHYGEGRSIPSAPKFSELKLPDEVIAEIESRFEALKPYLNKNRISDFSRSIRIHTSY